MATFGTLSDRLTETFRNLRTKGKLTPADVDGTVREIRRAMLDADPQRGAQLLLGAGVAAAGRGVGDAEQLSRLHQGQPLPVHEPDELGQVGIEAGDRVADIGTLVGGRCRGIRRQMTPDAIGERPSTPLASRMVPQRAAGDPEQPHARPFRIVGQIGDTPPGDDHRLPQKVGGIIEPHAPLQVGQEVGRRIDEHLGQAAVDRSPAHCSAAVHSNCSA